MADLTKAVAELLDWTLLDDTGSDIPSASSPDLALAVELGTILHIVVAHADTNDASTSHVSLKVMTKKGSANEDWGVYAELQAGGGQATKEDLNAQSASGQTHIEVADTTDFDTGLLERLFILDATPADSELVTIMGWADNDYYLADDNLTNTHENTADLLDGVDEIEVTVPPEFGNVKVLFGNSHGTATYYVRVDYERITEIN